MELNVMEDVELARRTFESRKADWRLHRVFFLNVPKATVEARFACLRRAMECTNWMQGYSAVSCLVETWRAEDKWERMVHKQIDPEEDCPAELFERPAGGTVVLQPNGLSAMDSRNGSRSAHSRRLQIDAISAPPAAMTNMTMKWNWDEEGAESSGGRNRKLPATHPACAESE
jgi:hypothetical protein